MSCSICTHCMVVTRKQNNWKKNNCITCKLYFCCYIKSSEGKLFSRQEEFWCHNIIYCTEHFAFPLNLVASCIFMSTWRIIALGRCIDNWCELILIFIITISLFLTLFLFFSCTHYVIQSLAVWTNTWPYHPAGQTIDGKCPWLNKITSARFVAGDKRKKNKI